MVSCETAGVQIFIENSQIAMRCLPAASDFVNFDFSLQLGRWYCLTLVHTNPVPRGGTARTTSSAAGVNMAPPSPSNMTSSSLMASASADILMLDNDGFSSSSSASLGGGFGGMGGGWSSLGISAARGDVRLYVDGMFWQTVEVEYPCWEPKHPGLDCSIGTSMQSNLSI